MPEKYVITVGRSFGSGGHTLAEALAGPPKKQA